MDNLFDNWNNIKKDINNKRANINIKEGCVYWINVGFNIGCEVNGKGENFARPVLVLKKIHINNTHHFDKIIKLKKGIKELMGHNRLFLKN